MRKLLLIFVLFIGEGFASTQELIHEFLKGNSDVIQSKARAQIKSLEEARVRAAKSWGLGMSGSYYKNELDGTILQGENRNYALSLNKDFFWGGHFVLSNGYGKVETYANSFMPQAASNYEFTQTVSYTQDLGKNFFGMDDRGEIRVAKQVSALERASSKHNIQGQLLNFYVRLVEMRLSKTMVALEKEALSRATRRTKMIKRRVRDGLLEKVDLLQAEMVELARKEAVKGAILNQDQSISRVSGLLHRRISVDSIEVLASDRTRTISKGDWTSSSEEQMLKKNIEFIKSNMRRVDYSFIPAVNLSTMYKTNSYDANSSQAVKNGSLGGEKAELSVGISVNLPLWFGPQKVEKQRLRVELQTAKIAYDKREQSFIEEERLLRNQIRALDNNIKSAKERIALAQKILKEYNKLYGLGRADLDQVIRSEEDLIGTEKSYINYLSQKEGLVSNLAYLCGVLEPYLLDQESM